jgi:hypothetical protein
MKPFELNISRKRGDTRRQGFVVEHLGRAVDISGWTNFKLGIDSRAEPSDNTTNIANLVGYLTVDGLDGRVHFLVPGAIATGNYYYDAQATDENGEIGTFVEGSWRVREDRAK